MQMDETIDRRVARSRAMIKLDVHGQLRALARAVDVERAARGTWSIVSRAATISETHSIW
jgi:hypothetical protein